MSERFRVPADEQSPSIAGDTSVCLMSVPSANIIAVTFLLQGYVQGVGVRPATARAARRLNLTGSVVNTMEGVRVLLEGPGSAIFRYEHTLREELPKQVAFRMDNWAEVSVVGCRDFNILEDGENVHAVVADVPQDLGMCGECAVELTSPSDRRCGYGFNSCTQCGPRYSILRSMPWERSKSTMACFGLCDACRTEFETLDDRRFHAQTIACPDCGPRLLFESASDRSQCTAGDAFESAVQMIRTGGILALKGLGGYQLICDARNPEAVRRLRRRKHRESRPFAVMISRRNFAVGSKNSDAAINAHAEHLTAEVHALTSPMNPIVLVSKAVSLTSETLLLAPEVSGDFKTTGLMLPTTPLHAMLLETLQTPLVVTSGNEDSEPIVFEEGSARQNLTGIADGWLHHTRPIERPIDDSVVRVIAGQTVTMRAGRGIAPLRLPLPTTHRVLAVGGEQKVACAFSNGHQAVLGPHLGNMSSLAMRQRFTEHVCSLERLYGAVPDTIVHDLHPDYFTSRWASDSGIRTLAVQHHHAHVVSCMLEHQILNSEVLGVAFDGSGFGTDGTIWGGEFLLVTQSSFRRVGHLMPFLLPGGEKAIDEPWRTAVSLLTTAIPEISAEDVYALLQHSRNSQECCICNPADDATFGGVALAKIRQVQQLVRGGHGPFTSSMGRIFDGISAIITGISQSGFEGEPAMRLESICDESSKDSDALDVKCVILNHHDAWCIDWRPIVKGIVRSIRAGQSPAALSRSFHLAIADVVVSFVERFPGHKVVLSGGCFHNRILSETISGRLALNSREVFTHGRVPPNDGGLAAGQMAVAAALLDLELEQEVGRCA